MVVEQQNGGDVEHGRDGRIPVGDPPDGYDMTVLQRQQDQTPHRPAWCEAEIFVELIRQSQQGREERQARDVEARGPRAVHQVV